MERGTRAGREHTGMRAAPEEGPVSRPKQLLGAGGLREADARSQARARTARAVPGLAQMSHGAITDRLLSLQGGFEWPIEDELECADLTQLNGDSILL